MNNIRVVFMGTPSFAVPIFESLIENYDVQLLVCQPDRKKDRKGNIEYPETKKVALKHNIEVFQPLKVKENYQKIINDYKAQKEAMLEYGRNLSKKEIAVASAELNGEIITAKHELKSEIDILAGIIASRILGYSTGE